MARKHVVIILTVLMVLGCLGLAACESGGATEEVVATTADDGMPKYLFSTLTGLWTRPEGYEPDGVVFPDQFLVVPEDDWSGTWQVLDEAGNMGDPLPAYWEGERLCLEMGGGLENVYFDYWLRELRDSEGITQFEKHDYYGTPDNAPPPEPSNRWFLNGDPNEVFYEFSGSSYQVLARTSSTTPFEEGRYELTTTTIHVGDEIVIENVPMYDMQGGFIPDDLYPTEDECMLVTGSYSGKYYIREDAIGTPEAERAALRASLIFTTWMYRDGQGGRISLKLGHPDYFGILEYDDEGYYEVVDYGTWRLDGDYVYLEYKDGGTDTIDLSEMPDALVVESSGRIYEGNG